MHHRFASLSPALIAALLLLGCCTLPAQALPEDREQPIRLQADRASFDQDSGVSTYEGNVEVSQGSMYLGATRATVHFDTDGRFQRMEATGDPARFRYRPSAERPPINGTGRRIEYDIDTARVIVSGSAHFIQGGDEFTGDRIVYDLDRNQVNASSGEGRRIEFIIQPRR